MSETIDHSKRPALATRTVATNLAGLYASPSFHSELLTQVTNGVPLDVLEERGEWCFVRQTDGYTGWAYAPYLDDEPAEPATHLLKQRMLFSAPLDRPGASVVTQLPMGTGVRVIETAGRSARIQPHGKIVPPGWTLTAFLTDLTSMPLRADEARDQMLVHARELTGAYYLWGGTTEWGIDCSGLAQLVHKLAGYTIPRDARLQFPAGKPVEPPLAPGDLLFFHSETDPNKIVHVAISAGRWKIIHSSRSRNGVYGEDLDEMPKLKSRFAGARCFVDRA